jgi:dTDP-4-amino-4,6-dideoxygalactose transaminase
MNTYVSTPKSEPAVAATPATRESGLPPLQFLDLKAQFMSIKDEVTEAVASVFENQQFILGKEVQALESELAAILRVRFAIGCGSGSDALYLALRALGIGPGDEVITTPFTFVATAGAIARAGAKPVFVDISPETFNMDPARISSAINRRTRAILPVHLFGLPADLDPILKIAREHQLAVVEDAAQAIGATYHGVPVGGFGEFGCFSFFPSKNLGCAGDGGLVATQTEEMAARLRILRVHGNHRKYYSEVLGINSRLDALQAAILRVKLRHLKTWEERRQSHAATYHKLFAEYKLEGPIRLPHVTPDCTHVYNQFVIRCDERDRLRTHLGRAGIPSEIYYPTPLHLQPAFAYLGHERGSFQHAEAASDQVLALPIYPELSEVDQERIVRCISQFNFTQR